MDGFRLTSRPIAKNLDACQQSGPPAPVQRLPSVDQTDQHREHSGQHPPGKANCGQWVDRHDGDRVHLRRGLRLAVGSGTLGDDDGLQLVFLFDLLDVPVMTRTGSPARSPSAYRNFPCPQQPTTHVLLRTNDRSCTIDRVHGDSPGQRQVLLSSRSPRGVPTVYMGQEIGTSTCRQVSKML